MKFATILRFAAISIAAFAAYLKLVRPRVLDWNATPDERSRLMPGDDLINDASLQTTRVITINALPDMIWPWLVQMGPKPRAGVYTYDVIERLLGIDIRNSDRIMPEYQHLDPGEYLALDEKTGKGIQVMGVEPERHIVLQWVPARSTWTFALYPQDGGTTRLVSRNRIPGSGFLYWLGMIAFMEPGSLVMERKMLLGIKERAERYAREPAIKGTSPETAPA